MKLVFGLTMKVHSVGEVLTALSPMALSRKKQNLVLEINTCIYVFVFPGSHVLRENYMMGSFKHPGTCQPLAAAL